MRFAPRVSEIVGEGGVAPRFEDLFARLADRRGCVALDSAGGNPRRYSLIAFDPLGGIELSRAAEAGAR